MFRLPVFPLIWLLLATPALAGPALPPATAYGTVAAKPPRPTALAPASRMIAGGRAVVVEFPQTAIETDLDIGRVISDAAYGGGLIGALILSEGDKKKQALTDIDRREASDDAAPLRDALKDYDFDTLAMDATKSGLSQIDWFAAQAPTSVKSPSLAVRQAAARTSGATQLATVTYRYALSPDFTQIRVIADVTIWRVEISRSKDASVTLSPLGQQRVSAISELRKRSYDHAENAAAWAADNGRLARAALTAGATRMEQLLPYALHLSQSEIDVMDRTKNGNRFAAGFYGAPIMAVAARPGETLIWSHGVISVMPTPDGSAGGTM